MSTSIAAPPTQHAGSGRRPLRILAVTDLFDPAVGGLERAVAVLSDSLVERGHEVRIATLSLPGLPDEEYAGGTQIVRLGGWQRSLRPLYQDRSRPFHPTVRDPGIVRGLVRLIDSYKPDIMHAHGWILHSCVAARRLRPQVQLVATLHDYSQVCPKKNHTRAGAGCDGDGPVRCVHCSAEQYGALRAAALTAGLRSSARHLHLVDAYVPISAAVLEASRAAIPPGPIVRIVPSPVSSAALELEPDTPRPPFLPAKPYLMFAGEVSPHKGVDVLIDAHRRLGHEPPLLICATRPPDPSLFRLPNTTVVVQRPHAQIIAAWRHCAVAVVPSVWQEPLGLSALEAMACGVPTVGTLVGGMRSTIRDEVDGLLVPPADARALTLAIRRLLDDPELAVRLGHSAYERARRYSARQVAEEYEQLYEELLDDG